MTVNDEQVPTINNWADEIDELNSRAVERHLRAVFWRWTRKGEAQTKIAQDKKIASGATGEANASSA